jgi:two-component system, chemotaxis family, sensor kinase CheA
MDKDQEFMAHLLETFRIEADEHLGRISSGLIELEKTEASERQPEIIEVLFRELHSLKGAARSVRLADMEAFCQAMEDLFAVLKRGEIMLSTEMIDLLDQAAEFLRLLLSGSADEEGEKRQTIRQELVDRLKAAAKPEERETAGGGEAEEKEETSSVQEPCLMPRETEKGREGAATGEKKAAPPPPFSDSPARESSRPPLLLMAETVRVATAKLSSVLLQAEEMLAAKLAAGQRVTQMRTAEADFQAWEKEWSRVLPDLQKIRMRGDKATSEDAEYRSVSADRQLSNLLEFLQWNRDFIGTLEKRYAVELRTAKHSSISLDGMVDGLLKDMKKLLMFPFSSLLESFPRIVREISRDSGKDVELVVQGGEIEVDRRILEEMKDPFVHMVRNCIDHGIENPTERRAKNKPGRGTITITISPRDDKVEVVVADDGAGISLDRVRAAVQKLGVLSREKIEQLSEQELLPFLFQSSVSTSPIITELSGRGLGLAIVKEKVEKLGGTVVLETEPDTGTRFRIVIPLTVATFRGIIMRAGEEVFVVPTVHVVRAFRLKQDDIGTVENRETIGMNGEAVSLARLPDVLGLPPGGKGSAPESLPAVVVLEAAGRRIAFLVDEVLGEQEVLLKGLGRQLSRVRNVAGATILGSGKLVPILNVPDLLKSAIKAATGPSPPGGSVAAGAAVTGKQSVMVVEDSITTRILLRNILEAAGYDVVTAVDGVDALGKLSSAKFDIVVSDVEMPRLNGFDLTSRIRTDKKLAVLPVVLVTALESREHRERGLEVGANAYIVKSSFDQSNLLDVIKRLI